MFGWLYRIRSLERENEMLWKAKDHLEERIATELERIKEMEQRRREDREQHRREIDALAERISGNADHINRLYGWHAVATRRSEAMGDGFVEPGPPVDDDPEKAEQDAAFLDKLMNDPLGGAYNAYDLIDEPGMFDAEEEDNAEDDRHEEPAANRT